MENGKCQYYYIAYFSSALEKYSDEDLKLLLQKSRNNNTQLGITGILMYYDGSFAQVLEGEYEEVNKIYQKISNDKRHRHIIKMKEGFGDNRIFPDWSMAFHTIKTENFLDISGFKLFVYKEIFPNLEMDENNPIWIVLKAFFESQPIYRRLYNT
jgi:Sensors of blue-light using FAD